MKSRKFNVVLLSGLSLLLALIIGISLIGIFTLNGVNRNFDEIYSNSFNMLIEAEQTYSCLICIQSAMKEAELAENPEQLNKALDEVIMHDKEISNSITYLKSVDCPNPWLDDVIAAYNDWLPIRNAELELIKHNGKPTEDLVAADNAQINLIKEKRQLFLDSEKKEIEGAHQSSDDFSSLALSTLIAISVCAIVVAVVMSLMVRSKLIKYRNKVYEEKELYRVTLESIGDGVITTDKDMNVIGLNKVAQYYTGWTEKEASGKSFREVFNITNEITGNRSKDPIEEVLVLGEKCELENHTILTSKQGDKRHIEDSAAPIKNDEGKILGVVMVFRDVSERKKMEKAIRDSEKKHRAMIANITDVIAIMNENGKIEYRSPNVEKWFGWDPNDLDGPAGLPKFHPEDMGRFEEMYKNLVGNEGAISTGEFRYICKDGTYRYVDLTAINLLNDQNIKGILLNYHDVTDRKRKEEEIIYLNNHDTLTGLYNRAFFEEEVKRLDVNRQLPLSVIMGDINGLKLTNDIFGHAEGDKLIKDVADILSDCCRAEDIVARIGGDEFCILLPKTNEKEAQFICKRIYDSVNLEKGSLCLSLGYATKAEIKQPIEAIIKSADSFMYKRKLLESKSMHNSLVSSTSVMMLEKTHETEEQIKKLASMARALGKELSLTEEQLSELELISALHDIGLININDSILNKPGELTKKEWSVIKKHPETGYKIACSSTDLISVAENILYHHERWDGSGYPKGLAGENIPLISWVFSVVDAFDAMTRERPFKKVISKEEAADEINKYAGTQFDPVIAKAFIEKVIDQNL